jgi:hypothetical protein
MLCCCASCGSLECAEWEAKNDPSPGQPLMHNPLSELGARAPRHPWSSVL